MRKKKYSIRDIAKILRRSPSTISEELKTNAVKNKYDGEKAHHKSYVRRRSARFQGKKIAMRDNLRSFVEEKLRDDLSPAAIAGRLSRHEHTLSYASKNSIYRFLKSPYGRQIEYERNKKKYRRKSQKKSGPLLNRRFIEMRPRSAEIRRRVGDAEADFIVSGKDGTGILLVVVDRKLRVSFLKQISNVTIEAVHATFVCIQEKFPELKTITTDNDILFQKHAELERLLRVKIYFCHPYHSWEKGTVENTNKYIRKDIPKGADISKLSKREIQKIEEKLNRRPMKCLNYFTPQELLNRHRAKKKSLKP